MKVVLLKNFENNTAKINNKVHKLEDVMKISNINTNNKAFVFENIENHSLIDYLDLIVPSVQNIIPELPEHITSIQEFKELVDSYNLDLDDYTSNNLKHVYGAISKKYRKSQKII